MNRHGRSVKETQLWATSAPNRHVPAPATSTPTTDPLPTARKLRGLYTTVRSAPKSSAPAATSLTTNTSTPSCTRHRSPRNDPLARHDRAPSVSTRWQRRFPPCAVPSPQALCGAALRDACRVEHRMNRTSHLVRQVGPNEDCTLVALANARTILGKRPFKYGSARWKHLRRVGGCIAGPCCREDSLCKELGLLARPVTKDLNWQPVDLARKRLPVLVTVLVWGDSCRYGVPHAALILECDQTEALISNAVPGGKAVDTYRWKELWLPPLGSQRHRAHTVALSDRPRWQTLPISRCRRIRMERLICGDYSKQWRRYPRMKWSDLRSSE